MIILEFTPLFSLNVSFDFQMIKFYFLEIAFSRTCPYEQSRAVGSAVWSQAWA